MKNDLFEIFLKEKMLRRVRGIFNTRRRLRAKNKVNYCCRLVFGGTGWW